VEVVDLAAPDTFELATIGALMRLDPKDSFQLSTQVTPDLFHVPRNRFMFERLQAAALNNTPLGAEAAAAMLKAAQGHMEHFGTHDGAVEAVLDRCVEAADPPTSWPQFAKHLKLAHARKVLGAALDEASIEAAGAASVSEATSIAIGHVIEATTKLRPMTKELGHSIGDLREGFVSSYECGDDALAFPQQHLNTIGGARPGNVVVVTAYTGVGKSWLGLDWATVWMRQGKRVRYYTLEMTEHEVMERLLAMEHGYKLEDVIERRVPAREIKDCLEILRCFSLEIVGGSLTAQQLISDVLSMGDEKPHVVVVDHLHLMDVIGKDYRLGLNDALRLLKTFAIENNIILVLLAQLRRPEQRSELPEPSLYMLKESGAIEQIADYAIFLHRRSDQHGDAFGDAYMIWTEKQRQGKPASKAEVRFRDYRFR
jgi:replicative DNA helicase